MCQAATVGGLMLYAGNGWFQSDSPQENFYPENLGSQYTQYFPPSRGEITSKFIMAFDTVIPFFQAWLPSLYLLIVIPSSFAYCLPQLSSHFWPWILVVTCFLVTRVCSSLLSVLGFCVCFAIIVVNQKLTPLLSSNIACQFHILKPWLWASPAWGVGRLGWAIAFIFILLKCTGCVPELGQGNHKENHCHLAAPNSLDLAHSFHHVYFLTLFLPCVVGFLILIILTLCLGFPIAFLKKKSQPWTLQSKKRRKERNLL